MGYINGKYYFQDGMSFGTTYQDFTLTFNFLYNDEECTSMVWNFNNSQTLPQYEVDLLNGLNVIAVKTYDISTALWLDGTFNISIPFQEVTTNFDFLVKNLKALDGKMTITLYQMTCEKNRIDKSGYITPQALIQGTLKTSTSILTPSIDINLPEFLQFNYAYIPSFERYYFLVDMVSVKNDLWNIRLRVDVLFSYEDEILNNNGLLERCEDSIYFNDYIVDNRVIETMNNENETSIITITPPSNQTLNLNSEETHEFNILFSVVQTNDTQSTSSLKPSDGSSVDENGNVIPSLGNLPITSNIKHYVVNYEQMVDDQTSSPLINWAYKRSLEIISNEISDNTNFLTDYGTYILDLKIFPCNIPHYSNASDIYVANNKKFEWSFTNSQSQIITNYLRGYEYDPSSIIYTMGTFKIEPYFNNFLDYSPFSKYNLFLPYIGFVQLDTTLYMNKEITIRYYLDFMNNKILVELVREEDSTNYTVLQTFSSSFGFSLPLTQENNYERFIQAINDSIQATTTLIALSVGVPQDSSSFLKPLTQDWRSKTQIINSTSGIDLSIYQPQHPYLIITRPKIIDRNGYDNIVGKPSYKVTKLDNLDGYFKVYDIHLENINASKNELEEIENLLKSGVIK